MGNQEVRCENHFLQIDEITDDHTDFKEAFELLCPVENVDCKVYYNEGYEDIWSEMHLAWYDTMMYSMIIVSIVLLVFIVYNSWNFGIKQKRFCQSKLLTSFYSFCFLVMIIFIVQSLFVNAINTNFVKSKQYEEW